MSPKTAWTDPEDLRRQLEKRWRRGELLAARVHRESPFPLRLRLRTPTGGEVAEHFEAVRDWARNLREHSREVRGHGYRLDWQPVRNRVHGTNRLPTAAWVADADDALALLGRKQDARRFDALVETTRARQPALLEWLARRPLTALEHAEEWPRLLAVVDYLQAHPRPGLYLRQLDIPGVDTKFIGNRRRLLAELLDLALPESAVDTRHTGARGFEARYGLRQRPLRLRFRVLDPALAIRGLTDLAVPVAELAALDPDQAEPPVRTVFITENEINGLAFPDHAAGLVIFGLGYALDQLGAIPWLHRVAVHYWGDIDTHGFAILERLRSHLPHTRSLLMDRETLDAHQALWVSEAAEQRFTGELHRLTGAEQALFRDLRDNALGANLRLEQERIGFGWLERYLCELPSMAAPRR
ncbi:DUF3322 domain-containing protein [Arhodomonas sp. KWT2]|uniref:DUF3322 domain-containing protein n=1 Tax=unclassified Arhodomonas TaxID=2621637 RepID=UPI0013D3E018|nr:DUF3322 and DUF2220 domain-containing protein [Arhodomonas sp. KWT]